MLLSFITNIVARRGSERLERLNKNIITGGSSVSPRKRDEETVYYLAGDTFHPSTQIEVET